MSTPAHKQTDPDKLPGQIVNPINTDMADDMAQYASPRLTRRGNPMVVEGTMTGRLGSNGTTASDLAKRVTWTTDPPLPEKFTPPFFLPRR